MGPPAPRPCQSCPYRRDVPSGVWAAEEYVKLAAYDADTASQPTGLFQCHQNQAGDRRARMCSGWVGTHGGDHLLAVRLAALRGDLTAEEAGRVMDYSSPVPLFDSGEEAAVHGMADIGEPGDRARAMIEKIVRNRPDIG
jgi:hypothetical protein